MDLDLDGLPADEPHEHRLHTNVGLKGFLPVLDGHELPDSGLQVSHDSLDTQFTDLFLAFSAPLIVAVSWVRCFCLPNALAKIFRWDSSPRS